MWRRLVVLAALGGAGAPPAVAQDPAARAALDAWRDSLAGVRDSAGLRRLEASTIAQARVRRDDPMLHLRLGFVAYRLGELAGDAKPRYEDAASEFEWATELRPEWPYAWYGLGLAELALGEHTVIAVENLRQLLGRDHLSKAANAFARAAQADPSFALAVVDLVNTALTQRIQPRLAVALQAVRRAASSPAGREPGVQLARGRVEREAGEADSALAGFRAALAAGADSGVALLELARTEFYARRAAGGATYHAGARAARSPAAIALYRDDLQWVSTADELAAFDTIAGAEQRAAWLAAFWARRDAAAARDSGERLREHYRRWFYARKHFRLVSRHRHYDITEVYRSGQAELDDRGAIYLRHGDPDRRANYVCPPAPTLASVESCAPNESWLYRRPEGDLVFHFAARGDVQDYKLVESLVDVLGFGVGVRAGAGGVSDVATLYQSRDGFGAVYRRLGQGLSNAGPALAAERRDGRLTIARGTRSDSYPLTFELPLDVVTSDFVVGRPAGEAGRESQALHIVFAIPADRLVAQPAAHGVVYPLRFRAVVADTQGRAVARLDTVRVFAARDALRRPAYLTGWLAVPAPPDAASYRLVVAAADGSAGEVVARDSLHVDVLDGRRFAVSDLVVGVPGSGLVWMSGADSVPLNPLGRVTEGGALELYYEVHGVTRGAAWQTQVEVAREGGRSLWGAVRGLFGGRRDARRLAFDDVAADAVARVRRTVTLSDLPRGSYLLTLRLIDPASGATLERRRRFSVVAR
jgi:GWxTD domain-containing protein